MVTALFQTFVLAATFGVPHGNIVPDKLHFLKCPLEGRVIYLSNK